MNSPSILIVGATGRIGQELASLLLQSGIKPRVLVRKSSDNQSLKALSLDIAYGDLNDKASLAAALQGITDVFMVTRDHPQQARLEGNLIDAAVQKGVIKVVKSSAFAAGLVPPEGYGLLHSEAEHKLIQSGLRWVILRPYMFMQNLLELADPIRSMGVLPLPLAGAKIALIDARDVALVAKKVLSGTEHDNQYFDLSGPEALTMGQCAEILAQSLGRKVRYLSPPYWFAALMMRGQGASAWDIRMRKPLFRMIRSGGEALVTDNVERLTGQKPRSLAKFLADYQDHF